MSWESILRSLSLATLKLLAIINQLVTTYASLPLSEFSSRMEIAKREKRRRRKNFISGMDLLSARREHPRKTISSLSGRSGEKKLWFKFSVLRNDHLFILMNSSMIKVKFTPMRKKTVSVILNFINTSSSRLMPFPSMPVYLRALCASRTSLRLIILIKFYIISM